MFYRVEMVFIRFLKIFFFCCYSFCTTKKFKGDISYICCLVSRESVFLCFYFPPEKIFSRRIIQLYLLCSILTIEIVTEFQKVKSLSSLTFIGFLLPSCWLSFYSNPICPSIFLLSNLPMCIFCYMLCVF